jgi:hypothetical protein
VDFKICNFYFIVIIPQDLENIIRLTWLSQNFAKFALKTSDSFKMELLIIFMKPLHDLFKYFANEEFNEYLKMNFLESFDLSLNLSHDLGEYVIFICL